MGPARRSEGGPRAPLLDPELDEVRRGYGLERGPARGEPGSPRVVTARVLHLPHLLHGGGGLALKVFSAEQRAEALVESSLLAHLNDGRAEGYRVQPLVRTASGEALLSLGERRVLVTRWVHGVHRSYREIDAAGWAELGRTLAALHLRLDEAPPDLPLRRLVDELRARDLDDDRRVLQQHRQRAAAIRRSGGRPLAEQVEILLADRLELLERHATHAQAELLAPWADAPDRPIHNDFNVHNYLFDEPFDEPFDEHGPPLILDWERAILAPREYEVCRCLNHLPLVAPAFAWAFVDGYLERRALDPERVAWAIDAAVTAHALKHWPIEPWLCAEPGSAERIAGMAEIVRSFVEGRPRLLAFVEELRARIQPSRTSR